MTDKELMNELEIAFEAMKKDLGFRASFEELEKMLFLRDFISKEGFVSSSLSRAVCHRMCDLYSGWMGYLHGLVVPAPHSMVSVTEAEAFNDDERNRIMHLIAETMVLISKNTVIGMTKDKIEEAKFIDEGLRFWNASFEPKMKEITQKANQHWIEKSKSMKFEESKSIKASIGLRSQRA